MRSIQRSLAEGSPQNGLPESLSRYTELSRTGVRFLGLEESGMIDCMSGVADTIEWPTPPEFFAVVDAEFHFTLDVCATTENAKCGRFYTLKENGLAQPWTGMVWMNPPYGQEIPRWIRKAYDVACAGDATVACLIPARTDTLWFHEFCTAGEIRFLKGRLTFTGSEWPAPFPSMLVIFHAHLDPGGLMKSWDWKSEIAAKRLSQEVLNFSEVPA